MPIKHIVLGGGGGGGLAAYGALKHLAKNDFWNIKDINSIYATSIGSLIGILLILCDDWDVLDDYIIKRPWENIIDIKPLDIINIWNNKGILTESIIKDTIKPFLYTKDLSIDITLKELFNYNNIDIHIYTTDISESVPKKIDISYKTHGDLKVYKAITMSAAIPILFVPIWDNSSCCIDGAFINNFPLDDCIYNNDNVDEILAIKIKGIKTPLLLNNNSNFLEYLYKILDGMKCALSTEDNQQNIKNIVECKLENTFNIWIDAFNNRDSREKIINLGIECAKQFLNTY